MLSLDLDMKLVFDGKGSNDFTGTPYGNDPPNLGKVFHISFSLLFFRLISLHQVYESTVHFAICKRVNNCVPPYCFLLFFHLFHRTKKSRVRVNRYTDKLFNLRKVFHNGIFYEALRNYFQFSFNFYVQGQKDYLPKTNERL